MYVLAQHNKKCELSLLSYWFSRASTPICANIRRKSTLTVWTFAIFRTHNSNCREVKGSLIKQMLIYVCCLSVVLCHRRFVCCYIFNRSRLADRLLHLLRLGEGTVFNILNSNSLQRYNFFLKYANNKSIKFVVRW